MRKSSLGAALGPYPAGVSMFRWYAGRQRVVSRRARRELASLEYGLGVRGGPRSRNRDYVGLGAGFGKCLGRSLRLAEIHGGAQLGAPEGMDGRSRWRHSASCILIQIYCPCGGSGARPDWQRGGASAPWFESNRRRPLLEAGCCELGGASVPRSHQGGLAPRRAADRSIKMAADKRRVARPTLLGSERERDDPARAKRSAVFAREQASIRAGSRTKNKRPQRESNPYSSLERAVS